MKKITIISISLAITVLVLTRCAEEGCQNPNAINYCSECTKDGEACIFEADVTFYHDSTTAANLLTDNFGTLFYYIGDSLIGSANASEFFSEAPECGDSKAVSGKARLERAVDIVRYSIRDGHNTEIMHDVVELKSKECQLIYLHYFN